MATTINTQRLIKAVEGLSQNISEIASILKDAEEERSSSAKSQQEMKKVITPADADSHTVSAKVTVEDVRAVLAEKSQDGLTAKVRDLLESFGAAKLSLVDPAKLPELLEAAKDLK